MSAHARSWQRRSRLPAGTLVALALLLLSACAASTPAAATPRTEGPEAPPRPPPPSAQLVVPPNTAIDAEATNYPYPYPVRFFRVQSQGQSLQMAYLDVPAANPNDRCVVLLHGKNFSAAHWGSTIDALTAQGFRVIAPDQIGFGKSSKPASYQYSFAQLARHTRDLLESLSLQRCSIVGHSLGGMLATRYALLYPAMVDHLVLVNPIGLEDYSILVPYRSVDEWYADELKQTPDTIREYQRTAYYGGTWKPEYEALAQLQAGFTLHPDWSRLAWVSALTYDMLFTQPVVHDFPRLRVPTRLIIGTRDRTAPGRKYALAQSAAALGDYTKLGQRARDAIPGAKLIELPGIGHVPQAEAFPQFKAALLDTLSY